MQLPGEFSFSCPLKINCGRHSLAHLPVELSAVGASAPLILANRDRVGKKRVKTVVDAFKTSGLTLGVYDRLSGEPDPEMISLLARMYRDGGCDSVVAVGSGSVVDTAKCLNLIVSAGDGGDAAGQERNDADPGPLRPLMMVATPGGNGDEATGYASDGSRRLCSRRLIPAAAFIDPAMMDGQDSREVADGALIALVHAVEAFLDDAAGPMCRAYAHTAIGLITQYLPPALGKTERKKSLCAVVNGQVAAGCAFSAVSPGICHTLALGLNEPGGPPRGFLMAMLLPYLLAEAGNTGSDQVGQLLYPMVGTDLFAMTAPDLKTPRTIALLWEFFDGLNARLDSKIPASLDQAGLTEEQIQRARSRGERGRIDDCLERIIETARAGEGVMTG
ncbi:alcohol dehydrogenase EutG [Desulfosarcina alkanivorans]|uniref:Alcohol dehydrogenase EutG n=1 Tax=Desulfosarcina alkanivorans TaxID=571177 RepID=A0A5K7YCH7_9BACT|nr:iron-containing alcohol dehydrogenase [Desulfosarcina alkanivorans]BBO66838.1 alcohol dehydrogenase EutG [Desulfosarcina alkanivorans]